VVGKEGVCIGGQKEALKSEPKGRGGTWDTGAADKRKKKQGQKIKAIQETRMWMFKGGNYPLVKRACQGCLKIVIKEKGDSANPPRKR